MLKGFRDFILRGNVVDLAVAVIIGGAFNAVVGSFTKDVLGQVIAAVMGKPDFGGLAIRLEGTPIYIGNFINAVVTFLIVASAVYFGVVAPLNALLARVKTAETPPAAAPTTKDSPECLSAIPIAARRCAHCGQPVA